MKYILALLLTSSSLYADRIYIDSEDLEISQDAFYVHIGGNMWREAGDLHIDDSGLYIDDNAEFDKKWKCPYCHMMWPLKSPCKNADCPSKYK